MSTNKFDGFDNTMSPVAADYVVGFGDVGGTDVEKRWSISVLKTLWQGMLNITRLARESSNYVQITGGALASSRVDIAAAGADANVHLWLSGKGAGSVQTPAGLNVGGDLVIGGYIALASNISMGGGTLNTQGGDIETQGGDISIGAGGILYTDTITPVGTDITLNGNLIVASNLTAGTGLNEFLIDSTKMQYGGASGLVVSSQDFGYGSHTTLQLGTISGFKTQISPAFELLQLGNHLGATYPNTSIFNSISGFGDHGSVIVRGSANHSVQLYADAGGAIKTAIELVDNRVTAEYIKLNIGPYPYVDMSDVTLPSSGYRVGGTRVLSGRKTGWTCTKHGTPLRNVDLSNAGITAVDLAQVLTALLEDLGTTWHGAIDQA